MFGNLEEHSKARGYSEAATHATYLPLCEACFAVESFGSNFDGMNDATS